MQRTTLDAAPLTVHSPGEKLGWLAAKLVRPRSPAKAYPVFCGSRIAALQHEQLFYC
jgi:hypothetical protein